MESATLLLVASAVIIILQIVSIILMVTGRKAAAAPAASVAVSPANNDTRDFGKRRDENRFNRKQSMDQRQKPITRPEPQPVDRVETSLRDINLKLKNAERDQENARRKIRDGGEQPQSNNPQRRFDQNNQRPNRGRDDDFRRRDRHGRPQGGNFRDRERGHEADRVPRNEAQVQPASQAIAPGASAPAHVPEIAPRPQNPAPVQPVTAKEPVVEMVPDNNEVFHGRKMVVRRRILTQEEQAAAGSAQNQEPSAAQPAIGAVTEASGRPETGASRQSELPDEAGSNDISFGR